jgi:hypothetical protein
VMKSAVTRRERIGPPCFRLSVGAILPSGVRVRVQGEDFD